MTVQCTLLPCNHRRPTSFLFLPSSSLDFFLEGLLGSSPPLAWSILAQSYISPPETLQCDLLKSYQTSPSGLFLLLFLTTLAQQIIQVRSSQNPFLLKKKWRTNSSWLLPKSCSRWGSSCGGGLVKEEEKKRCGNVMVSVLRSALLCSAGEGFLQQQQQHQENKQLLIVDQSITSQHAGR